MKQALSITGNGDLLVTFSRKILNVSTDTSAVFLENMTAHLIHFRGDKSPVS
jgi:hypothetical protein